MGGPIHTLSHTHSLAHLPWRVSQNRYSVIFPPPPPATNQQMQARAERASNAVKYLWVAISSAFKRTDISSVLSPGRVLSFLKPLSFDSLSLWLKWTAVVLWLLSAVGVFMFSTHIHRHTLSRTLTKTPPQLANNWAFTHCGFFLFFMFYY